MLSYILLSIFATFTATAAVAFFINKASKEALLAKLDEIETTQDDLLVKKTFAETKLLNAAEQIAKLENEKATLVKEKDAALRDKNNYQREKELAEQRILDSESRMADWQKTKEQHIEITKASILEVGSKISSKLLDDHKRESEAAKKESEKIVRETTEELHKKFQNVFESMSNLNERVNKSSDTVDIVRRSLLSPAGAGSLAEITLENIFKASGLIENQDYKMQYWVAGNDEKGGLKPDAIVYLPGNNVLVVDSKASKFFVEMGHAEDGSILQNELGESLKKTMNNHLKDLVSRNYKEAVEKQLGNVNATILMFLPSETALEKLRSVDAGFNDKAWKERIIPVGPSGLVTMLINATLLISNAQQEENSKVIIDEVRDLLGSVVKLYELAGSLGKGLTGVFKKYDDFAASFNRNFLSKAKKLQKLGVNAQKITEVKPLERLSIEARNYKQIEAEAEEEGEEEVLESLVA